jgi:hypothetical protein
VKELLRINCYPLHAKTPLSGSYKGQVVKIRFIILLAAAALVSISAHAATSFGHFVGKFLAEFGADGRKVTLLEPYGFVDPVGKEWDVPKGYKTDGASVPTVLWALYPPFTGKYRSDAVIHDYYCDTMERTWQATHKVFYYAMRAAHVDEETAKIMYAAVYLFGPRWSSGTRAPFSPPIKATPEQQEVLVKKFQQLVEEENPDLDTLVAKAKHMSLEEIGAKHSAK